jgi:hypothetical protein
MRFPAQTQTLYSDTGQYKMFHMLEFQNRNVRTRVTRYEAPEDIYNCHCRESIPEDCVLTN